MNRYLLLVVALFTACNVYTETLLEPCSTDAGPDNDCVQDAGADAPTP